MSIKIMATRDQKRNELIEYLKENGPSRIDKLRDITIEPPRRFKGVQDFRINPSRSSGSSVSSSGSPLRIAYLEEHEDMEILRVWADYHQTMIEEVSADAIYRATPEEFRDAMRNIVDVDEYYSDRGGDNSDSGSSECSLCGKTYDGDLPTHLEKDCDGT